MQIKQNTLRKIQGTILAILFGLVGSIPWIIIGYFGWIASLAGLLIGHLAYKGYVKGAGFFDKYGKAVIIAVIIFIVPFAEMVNIFIEALKYNYFILDALIVTPLFFFEYIGDYLPNILIGYLMAALGTYRIFTQSNDAI